MPLQGANPTPSFGGFGLRQANVTVRGALEATTVGDCNGCKGIQDAHISEFIKMLHIFISYSLTNNVYLVLLSLS